MTRELELRKLLEEKGIKNTEKLLEFEEKYAGIEWYNGYELGQYGILLDRAGELSIVTDRWNEDEPLLVQCLQVNCQDALHIDENGSIYNAGGNWKANSMIEYLKSDQCFYLDSLLIDFHYSKELTDKYKSVDFETVLKGYRESKLLANVTVFSNDQHHVYVTKGTITRVYCRNHLKSA